VVSMNDIDVVLDDMAPGTENIAASRGPVPVL
jgi:hypothetical protein